MDTRLDLQVNKKALEINLDQRIYGTFAEIGAGQEVARRFFHAGGAAGTVAKTMSAYDMTFSDSIYGQCGRYVSRERLCKMLDHEFDLLIERLDEKFGAERCFFVFADTVAARSFRRHDESHGWVGVRFQSQPRSPASEVIMHVRMMDRTNSEQQEALGIIGVNLIYEACLQRSKPENLIKSLLDDLGRERIEVDMVRFRGPVFQEVDNRLAALQLVAQGLTDAAMFRANGEVVPAAEEFYKKSILVERGSFRPVTNVTNDMLDRGLATFIKQPGLDGRDPLVLMEITMQNLLSEGRLDLEDFLDRADMLGALGRTVLISNYGEYYRLVQFLTRYTEGPIGLVIGVPSMAEIFDEKYYARLEGGILEGLGRLFKKGVSLLVYPSLRPDGEVWDAGNFEVAGNLLNLYRHLFDNGFIKPLIGCHSHYLANRSAEVLAKIRRGDSDWETFVPDEVAKVIKERGLFGIPSTAAATVST